MAPSLSFAFVSITIAPPALVSYDQPPCPQDGYLWTPGYWASGDDGYYWVPGAWTFRGRVGFDRGYAYGRGDRDNRFVAERHEDRFDRDGQSSKLPLSGDCVVRYHTDAWALLRLRLDSVGVRQAAAGSQSVQTALQPIAAGQSENCINAVGGE